MRFYITHTHVYYYLFPQKPTAWQWCGVPQNISILWKFVHSKHWEFHGFSSTLNLRGREEHGESLCYPILFPYYVNLLFHILGTAWISASPEIVKKPINLKSLCFPVLFPYYGNPLSPCFWNCMDFCFMRGI